MYIYAYCDEEILDRKAIHEPHNSTDCEADGEWKWHVFCALCFYDQPLKILINETQLVLMNEK